MLDFIKLDRNVWNKLSQRTFHEIMVYIALFYDSSVFTCETHPANIKTIAKNAHISDVSNAYRALRRLVKFGFLEKLKTERGMLQYKFLMHTPLKRKGNSHEGENTDMLI